MFERRVEGLPCSRSDAETQAAAWRRVAWRGRKAGNSASMGQGQCLSLRGNHWAGERRDHEDGMEGAGPWGATQVPRAVRGLPEVVGRRVLLWKAAGRVSWGAEVGPCAHSAVASVSGKHAEHQLSSRDPRHPFPPFARACWDFRPLCFKKRVKTLLL